MNINKSIDNKKIKVRIKTKNIDDKSVENKGAEDRKIDNKNVEDKEDFSIHNYVKNYQSILTVILSGVAIVISAFVKYCLYTYICSYYGYFNIPPQDITEKIDYSRL